MTVLVTGASGFVGRALCPFVIECPTHHLPFGCEASIDAGRG